LVMIGPRLNRWLEFREVELGRRAGALTALAVYLSGVYGGYFGAAQGILLLGILGVAVAQDLQRTNALKNVLAGLVNAVAGVFFVLAAHVEWAPAGIIAGASILGAQLGARYGRRLAPDALRWLVVVVGVVAIVRLLFG
ncbi:MAG: sulfite exporter TauE/SafE family protein, partial [Actinomycetota bacterium]|nr:sulfite exporter TauE/SafE family protein [Actinomycetota bacterium]